MNKFVTAQILAIGLAFSLTGCDPAAPVAPPTPNSEVVTSTHVEVTTTPAASATPEGFTATPEAEKTPGTAASATPAPAKAGTGKALLEPFPGVPAPALKKIVKVKFKTDLGDILIDMYPEAAPKAAKRFTELIQAGFYDNTPVFRVVPGFVAQFGINSKFANEEKKEFNDDPSYFKLAKGTLAFAKSGVNHNSTQVFIDYADNSNLRAQGFTAFAVITKGEDLAFRFKVVADPRILDQGGLWKDTEGLLKALPDKPTMILKAEIVK